MVTDFSPKLFIPREFFIFIYLIEHLKQCYINLYLL